MSIDRINNDGNYEPANCRWATPQEQANGKSTNRIVVFDGESLTLAEWARHLGMTYSKLQTRLDRLWPLHLALDPMATRRDLLAWNGKLKTTEEPPERSRSCEECKTPFVALRAKQRFCSGSCRYRKTNRDWHNANSDAINDKRRARYAAKAAK